MDILRYSDAPLSQAMELFTQMEDGGLVDDFAYYQQALFFYQRYKTDGLDSIKLLWKDMKSRDPAVNVRSELYAQFARFYYASGDVEAIEGLLAEHHAAFPDQSFGTTAASSASALRSFLACALVRHDVAAAWEYLSEQFAKGKLRGDALFHFLRSVFAVCQTVDEKQYWHRAVSAKMRELNLQKNLTWYHVLLKEAATRKSSRMLMSVVDEMNVNSIPRDSELLWKLVIAGCRGNELEMVFAELKAARRKGQAIPLKMMRNILMAMCGKRRDDLVGELADFVIGERVFTFRQIETVCEEVASAHFQEEQHAVAQSFLDTARKLELKQQNNGPDKTERAPVETLSSFRALPDVFFNTAPRP
eukprot:TRINITY_DN10680_c0_g1_i1.p1 TRINITY_DN10680_c0_g1~~TRINITY_DN10680_c0_g1_i1.p1  ORF type:complete len:381 (-),score=78.41 TRINITY_DN10680_c0_g1_i1:102-1184(-)